MLKVLLLVNLCHVSDHALTLYCELLKSHSKCLADLCGALHCDLVMNSKTPKAKCNPAAAVRNRHLCESLADSCFPVNHGLSASRLHDIFLRQFCDAHTCSGGGKPFSRGGMKQPSIFYLAISILTLMMLPVFYVIRNEKGNPRAEAHLTTWVENKAVLVGQAIGIINQQMGDAHGTFNHKGQLTKVDIRENSSEMVLESQDYHYISNKVGTLIWEEAAKKKPG
ncbi:hypothetical protein CK203_058935 [Vitis vinifera]|uniref:Uncharacterized protein n=1 Tax=Vitis vinifera TaxID=29760 RepID=A0A438FQ34_VITVI|nr:hypothetical protein CK203_058935 [Vitis vinifera]